MADFTANDQGTIVLLTPETKAGKTWAKKHLPSGAMQFGGAIVIEHRYADDILTGIADDGLLVEVV